MIAFLSFSLSLPLSVLRSRRICVGIGMGAGGSWRRNDYKAERARVQPRRGLNFGSGWRQTRDLTPPPPASSNRWRRRRQVRARASCASKSRR